VQFTLGKTMQLDRFSSSRKTVFHRPQANQIGRPGDQEPTGTTIPIDRGLDRQHQLRCTLNLVDHQQAIAPFNEGPRIGARVLSGGFIVEGYELTPVI
jgi:hypothetical protein